MYVVKTDFFNQHKDGNIKQHTVKCREVPTHINATPHSDRITGSLNRKRYKHLVEQNLFRSLHEKGERERRVRLGLYLVRLCEGRHIRVKHKKESGITPIDSEVNNAWDTDEKPKIRLEIGGQRVPDILPLVTKGIRPERLEGSGHGVADEDDDGEDDS